MRILFWGSSEFSVPFLEELTKRHKVVGVVTNPDKPFGRGLKEIHQTPVKLLALSKGIPVLDPQRLRDTDFCSNLDSLKPDLSVIVSYGKIIPEDLIFLPRFHSVNVHASLLPSYRGPSPIQATLANGDSITGNTVQFINQRMDEGDIISQNRVNIEEEDDYLTLEKKLSSSGVALLSEVLPQIENQTVVRLAQDHNQATYTRLIKKEDGRVCFSCDSAREIFNKWRAYKHWPSIYIEHPVLTKIVLTEVSVIGENSSREKGQIVKTGKDGLWVQTKDGILSIRRLKPAGKKEIDYLSYINGYQPEIGKNF